MPASQGSAVELLGSNQFFAADFFAQNPVVLISGERPGCGASTLAQNIGREVLALGFDVHSVNVGRIIRDKVGASNEAELSESFDKVDDPTVFDRELYEGLPKDKVCIVDGKLATKVGPQHIDPDRPLLSIGLKAGIITSGVRIIKREAGSAKGALSSSEDLLTMMQRIDGRTEHSVDLTNRALASTALNQPARRGDFMELTIDTELYCGDEVVDSMFGRIEGGLGSDVLDWEKAALNEAMANLAYLNVMLNEKNHVANRTHYDHNFESLRYNIERLGTHHDPSALAKIRGQIKKSLTDCWLGLLMKEMPRFFIDDDGVLAADTVSHAWTPEYYKIAEAWPVLSTYLKGKTVLDPFGGAGTLMHLLAARGVIKSGRLTDISYPDKNGAAEYVDGSDHYYAIEANRQMARVLFDELPSWYRPNLGAIKEYRQADARNLPYKDKSFDYVVSDPPYSLNHESGGIGLTIGSLPEFERVSKSGSILMVPMKSARTTDWESEIRQAGYEVVRLTEDLSRGNSGVPLRYIHVLPRRKVIAE